MKSVVFKSGSGSPGTAAWHEWRANGIGASDAPIIAAHAGLIEPASWMSSQHKLWEQKLGLALKPKVNAAMRRGTDGEAAARDAVERATGLVLYPVFGEMEVSPFIRASFDGMDFDNSIIVEIKCPSKGVHDLAKSGKVVSYYLPQLAHQALVAWGLPGDLWENKTMVFASFVPETNDLACVQMTGVELMSLFPVNELYAAEKLFWTSVEARQPPCGVDFLTLAAQYREIAKRFALVETELENSKNRLKDFLGEQTRMEGGGVLVFKSTAKPSVDWEAVARKVAETTGAASELIEAAKLACLKKARTSTYIKLTDDAATCSD